MPRFSRVRDVMLFWAAIGVIVGGIVASSGPAAPSREDGAEKTHRCHPGCEVYNHSAEAWGLHAAAARALEERGIEDPPDLGR